MKNGNYILVIAPQDYPGKKYRNKYAYEHHVVYWKAHKIIPTKTKVIHHKNHNKHDNKIENLELITAKKHNSNHSKKPWTYVFLNCFYCGNQFRLRGNHYRTRIKYNNEKFYCDRSCQVKAQWKQRKIKPF